MSDDHKAHRRSRPSVAGLARLASALPVTEPLRVVRRLRGGIASATHLLAAGDAQFVLKRYPSRPELVEAEWRGLVIANDAALPVPAAIAVDSAGEWFESPALVMSRIAGRGDLAPRNTDSYVEDVSEVLARVHAVPVESAVGLRTLEPSSRALDEEVPEGLLPRNTLMQVREAIAVLPEIAAGEAKTFCHGDCHPGNLLWRRGRLTGLIDWSHACTGFRWWEMASMRLELALFTDWDVAAEVQRRYEARVGLHSQDQALWDLFSVHAAHRWAHAWLEGYQEQGRTDLDVDQLAVRLTRIAQLVLASL